MTTKLELVRGGNCFFSKYRHLHFFNGRTFFKNGFQ